MVRSQSKDFVKTNSLDEMMSENFERTNIIANNEGQTIKNKTNQPSIENVEEEIPEDTLSYFSSLKILSEPQTEEEDEISFKNILVQKSEQEQSSYSHRVQSTIEQMSKSMESCNNLINCWDAKMDSSEKLIYETYEPTKNEFKQEQKEYIIIPTKKLNTIRFLIDLIDLPLGAIEILKKVPRSKFDMINKTWDCPYCLYDVMIEELYKWNPLIVVLHPNELYPRTPENKNELPIPILSNGVHTAVIQHTSALVNMPELMSRPAAIQTSISTPTTTQSPDHRERIQTDDDVHDRLGGIPTPLNESCTESTRKSTIGNSILKPSKLSNIHYPYISSGNSKAWYSGGTIDHIQTDINLQQQPSMSSTTSSEATVKSSILVPNLNYDGIKKNNPPTLFKSISSYADHTFSQPASVFQSAGTATGGFNFVFGSNISERFTRDHRERIQTDDDVHDRLGGIPTPLNESCTESTRKSTIGNSILKPSKLSNIHYPYISSGNSKAWYSGGTIDHIQTDINLQQQPSMSSTTFSEATVKSSILVPNLNYDGIKKNNPPTLFKSISSYADHTFSQPASVFQSAGTATGGFNFVFGSNISERFTRGSNNDQFKNSSYCTTLPNRVPSTSSAAGLYINTTSLQSSKCKGLSIGNSVGHSPTEEERLQRSSRGTFNFGGYPEPCFPSSSTLGKRNRKLCNKIVTAREENVSNVLQMSCRLFVFDGTTSTWIERGIGQLRLNDKVNKDQPRSMQSRIIVRTKGSRRHILNTNVWSGMKIEKPAKQLVAFTANDNRSIRIFVVQSTPNEADDMFSALGCRIRSLLSYETPNQINFSHSMSARANQQQLSTINHGITTPFAPPICTFCSSTSTSMNQREEIDSSEFELVYYSYLWKDKGQVLYFPFK